MSIIFCLLEADLVTIRLSDLIGLIDIVGSYIIFGLALYAMSGLLMILRARLRERSMSREVRKDFIIINLSLVSYMLIEACRQVWDSFRPDHFPIWPSRFLLVVLLPMTGNAAYRLYHRREEWFHGGGGSKSQDQPTIVKRKVAVQPIHPNHGRPLFASIVSSALLFVTKWSPLALFASKTK